VQVHLHTTLQRRTPEGLLRRLEVELLPASTLCDLLEQLAIPSDREAILMVINGRMADPKQTLNDGDEVHLIPAISGGVPAGTFR
jgi:molybdopterin converting factor small subunit